MSFPLINVSQFFDSSGAPLAAGTIEFKDPTSNAYINTYPTADDADAQTNANDNPLTLNARGEAATGIYLEDGVKYRIILKDSEGAQIWDQDDVRCPIALPYLQTATESAASVTPTNVEYPPGDVRRYGAVGDAVTDDTTAIQNAITVGGQSNGPTVTGGGVTYAVNGALTDTLGASIEDIVIEHTGSGIPLTVYSGSDAYLQNISYKNVRISGTGSTSTTGMLTKKVLRSSFYDLSIRDFTSTNAIGLVLEGTTATRFFNCTVLGSYTNMEIRDYVNLVGGVHVPANANKFFGCTFNDSTGGNSVFCLDDTGGTGIQSGGNENGFVGCWFEDNAGYGIYNENGGDWSVIDCRFESNTGAQIKYAPTVAGARINRAIGCVFSAISGTPEAHVVIGANSRGTYTAFCKFSTTDTAWTDNGTQSRFYGNRQDGNPESINDVTIVEDTTVNTATVTALTALGLTGTDRADGNGWVEYTIASGEITWNGELFIQVDTEADAASDDLDTINGGSSGDILIMKAANAARTIDITASTSGIRVPSGGISFDNGFQMAVFVHDGFSRWNLLSFSDNA